jgi:hypothetical protein
MPLCLKNMPVRWEEVPVRWQEVPVRRTGAYRQKKSPAYPSPNFQLMSNIFFIH